MFISAHSNLPDDRQLPSKVVDCLQAASQQSSVEVSIHIP